MIQCNACKRKAQFYIVYKGSTIAECCAVHIGHYCRIILEETNGKDIDITISWIKNV